MSVANQISVNTLVSVTMLLKCGFSFDSEDNLWYAKDNGFRVGVSENKRFFHLFYGGYTIDLGNHQTEEEFKNAAFKFNGTIF